MSSHIFYIYISYFFNISTHSLVAAENVIFLDERIVRTSFLFSRLCALEKLSSLFFLPFLSIHSCSNLSPAAGDKMLGENFSRHLFFFSFSFLPLSRSPAVQKFASLYFIMVMTPHDGQCASKLKDGAIFSASSLTNNIIQASLAC